MSSSPTNGAVRACSLEELEQRQVRIVSDVLRDVPGVAPALRR